VSWDARRAEGEGRAVASMLSLLPVDFPLLRKAGRSGSKCGKTIEIVSFLIRESQAGPSAAQFWQFERFMTARLPALRLFRPTEKITASSR
jgi:hypothetical protein